jgi:hypothetical protein
VQECSRNVDSSGDCICLSQSLAPLPPPLVTEKKEREIFLIGGAERRSTNSQDYYSPVSQPGSSHRASEAWEQSSCSVLQTVSRRRSGLVSEPLSGEMRGSGWLELVINPSVSAPTLFQESTPLGEAISPSLSKRPQTRQSRRLVNPFPRIPYSSWIREFFLMPTLLSSTC